MAALYSDGCGNLIEAEGITAEGRVRVSSDESVDLTPADARAFADDLVRAADRAEARTTLPDDLRRQVLAAVHNAQRACERILAAFEHSTPREDLAYSVGVVAMRSAILAEFALNPDGTMKEPPA